MSVGLKYTLVCIVFLLLLEGPKNVVVSKKFISVVFIVCLIDMEEWWLFKMFMNSISLAGS